MGKFTVEYYPEKQELNLVGNDVPHENMKFKNQRRGKGNPVVMFFGFKWMYVTWLN